MSISPQQIFDVCTKKLNDNPEQPEILLARSSAALRLQMPEIALQDMQKYLKKNPNDIAARLMRAECYEQANDKASALADLGFVLHEQPQHSQALYRRAKLLAENQDRPGAIQSFQQAIEADHNSKSQEASASSSVTQRSYLPFQPQQFSIVLDKKSAQQVIRNRVAALSSQQGVDFWLSKGQQLRHSGQLEDATASFTRALQEDPLCKEALLNRAFCYDQLEQFQSAIFDYENVLKIDKSCALAWHNLGVCYDKLSNREQALECFNSALAIDQNVDFLISRAWTYRQLERYSDALSDYNAGLQLQPNNYKLLFARAFTYEKSNNLTLSLQDYSQCIKISPQQFAYHNRGNVLARLNQHQLAIQDFNKAIEINPDAAESYSSRAQSYLQLKQKEQAIQDFRQAHAISKSLEHGLALADALRRIGEQEQALKQLNDLIAQFPESQAEILGYRALVYRKLGDFQKCLEDANKALLAEPLDVKLLTNRGYAYAQMQNFELAVQDFTSALRLEKNAQLYLNRGTALNKMGKQQEALRDLNMALQLNPNDSAAFFARGAALDALGKYEEAMSDYTKALELENQNPQDSGIPRTKL